MSYREQRDDTLMSFMSKPRAATSVAIRICALPLLKFAIALSLMA